MFLCFDYYKIFLPIFKLGKQSKLGNSIWKSWLQELGEIIASSILNRKQKTASRYLLWEPRYDGFPKTQLAAVNRSSACVSASSINAGPRSALVRLTPASITALALRQRGVLGKKFVSPLILVVSIRGFQRFVAKRRCYNLLPKN